MSRLRPTRCSDLPALVRLERDLFPHDAWSEEQWRSELAGGPETRHHLVAVAGPGAGDEVVGYGGLLLGPDDAEVLTLAVAPTHQGRGVGRSLLEALLAEAGRRGLRTVLLEVRADNAPALALYGSCGFERLSVRRGYYSGSGGGRVDALVLRRRRSGSGSGDGAP